LVITALDERWANQLLENPSARSAILHLTSLQPGFEFRNLIFQPEALQLQIYLMKLVTITPVYLRGWFTDLIELVGIAETLPGPHVTALASPMERETQLNRSELTLRVFGITCVVIAFFVGILVILTITIINLA
jgi:hypothetical protein